ncbi:MAG: EF-P lysine aminoacylase GenX [Candidatus Magasanikbacteria bacterium]|nr:EF-P lysine aminoacylase GenX [Candidatus Magasanikbacteria bacterium]
MEQILHISKNEKNFVLRAKIIKIIRNFFENEGFLELDPPILIKYPDSEPNLSPISVEIQNEKKENFNGFLHTSPEYTMKKTLASGFKKIFTITHCFRNCESFGGHHNPEFTMLEWYRAEEDFYKIMKDCEDLLKLISQKTGITKINGVNIEKKWEKISMKELWQKYVNVNLDKYCETSKMYKLCKKLGFNAGKNEPFEDLFYRIFLNKIEEYLGKKVPTIVYNYPAQMASLAKISKENPKYAERFELYVNGIELANAFSELTDENEQRKRIEKDNPHFGIDEEFINAVEKMPKSAGIALGVDRLIMLFANCKKIENILLLPTNKLFNLKK